MSERFPGRVSSKPGRRLELVSDAEPPRAPELLLGLTNRTPRTVKDPIAQHDDGVLLSHPFGVQLWGSSPSGVSQAIRAFLSLLEQAPQSGGNACVELPGKLLSRPDDVLRVFSQNILYNEIRPDRASRLLQTVMNEAPDVFGIQEGGGAVAAPPAARLAWDVRIRGG